MNKNYDTYIETMNGLEVVEEQLTKENRIKRCCYLPLEFVKAVIIGLKMLKKSK